MDVLFSSPEVLVVNKPPLLHSVPLKGAVTEPTGDNLESRDESVAKSLLHRFPELAQASPAAEEAGLVQRLDFETSGALIAARSRSAWDALRGALRDGTVEKVYWTVAHGRLADSFAVRAYLGSPYRRGRKVRVRSSPAPRFQSATTQFHPLEYCAAHNITLVRVILGEGRRHQIRAHAAFSGHPLWGDALYQRLTATEEEIEAATDRGSPRPPFFLHSRSLTFSLPGSAGGRIGVTAPLPPAFRELLNTHFPLSAAEMAAVRAP